MEPTQLLSLTTAAATVIGAAVGSLTTLLTTYITRRDGQRTLHAGKQLDALTNFWDEARGLRGWGTRNDHILVLSLAWEKNRALVPRRFNRPGERLVAKSREAALLTRARREHDRTYDALWSNVREEERALGRDLGFPRVNPGSGLEGAQELFDLYRDYLDGWATEEDARRAVSSCHQEGWVDGYLDRYFGPERNPLYVRERQQELAWELADALDDFEDMLNDWINGR
ncbi:hypothetical protein ACFZDF_19855 [Streptomyces sp. NPDC007910]|uniref:hypothetical protein n=1 Tax=Streptomyces sp. NPDC007910 TaxID=3364790 RepID=UPI0036DFB225